LFINHQGDYRHYDSNEHCHEQQLENVLGTSPSSTVVAHDRGQQESRRDSQDGNLLDRDHFDVNSGKPAIRLPERSSDGE